MKKRNLIIVTTFAAGLGVAAAAGIVNAHSRGGFGPGFGGPGSMHGPGVGFDGPGHMRELTRALDLSEEQRDKIFGILHAQQPAVRDKLKVLRKGRDELRAATATTSYDAKRVRELANAQAKVVADLIVMRSETFNKVYGQLTPAQQQKAAELKEHLGRGPHGW